MNSYEKKISEQKQQYESGDQIHDLPDIFHVWSQEYLLPKLNAIFDCSTVPDFYANSIERAFAAGAPKTVISIGSGDCSLELSVAESLIKRGVDDFRFECLEVAPNLISAARHNIKQKAMEGFLFVNETDINKWTPACERSCGAVMANHSLHHIVELERLFDSIYRALDYRGCFITNDMIGRNGHMRWPEVLEYVNSIWALMRPEKKLNHQFGQIHHEYVNFDCSTHGFEGVRAQDILPLLLQRFGFSRFLAFGGLTEVFFDRAYGNNFSKADGWDVSFLDFVALLNDRLIDGGLIKPTMMFAELKISPCSTKNFKHWSPEFCVRLP